ncbi:MAG: hypothetical protein M1296_03715 [Chloroflexi bacterium]|nr:hypothetical protein [Chloroflexota bacterium]
MRNLSVTRRLPPLEEVPDEQHLPVSGGLDSASLLQLVDEQETLIEQRSRDLAVARRSLDRARTQWLVLENYDATASSREREEAAMHLEGIAAYVQQLEEGIEASRALIRAYKRARFDNLPWVRAYRFVRKQVNKQIGAYSAPALEPRGEHPALQPPREGERRV